MTDEHYKEWLKNLKVGDKVIVEQQYTSSSLTISEVMRVTIEGSHRVKRHEDMLFKDGTYRAGGYASYCLREPTDELLDKINLINIRRKLKSTDWSKVDGGIVRDVWNMLNAED